ncbi:MAG: plasmid pRiA4b ORF-3 family protein [Clostridiales bacterium]|nr:plasmid pRiA4b ORF-3 family protein [Clostridiales bacterium]
MNEHEVNTCEQQEVTNELFAQVTADYEGTHSVRKTAKNCHISMVTAQRILITAGMWSSKSSKQVKGLLDQGMTVEQIAQELSLTKDAVYAYMPYSRGNYGVKQTEDSQYSKDYRERMEAAAEGMHKGNVDGMGEVDSMPVLMDNLVTEQTAASKKAKHSALSSLRFDPEFTEELADRAREDVVFGDTYQEYGTVYALHLSLVGGFVYGADEDMDMRPEDRAELLKLAKAESAISRDILVPGTMNLHALHYAIQKLFGWQNSHLHNFSIPQEDFDALTAGTLGGYTDLCGVLFRFPDDDMSDLYWDDDYKKGVSVKSWLKKKYSAPFRQYSVGDSYLGNLWEIEGFRDRFPDFKDEITLKEILNKVAIEQDWNFLAERLTIRELFAAEHDSARAWKGDVVGKLELLKEELEDEKLYNSEDEMKEAAAELRNWRQSYSQLDHLSWVHPDTYKKEIEGAYKKPYDDVIKIHEEQMNAWAMQCLDLFRNLNINLSPYFDTLYYLYDYGDDWCVKITLEEIYHKTEDEDFVDNDMCRISKDLKPVLEQVDAKEKIVCMAADGLNVVDDCGGLHGYLNMLQTINGEDKEKANDMKEWARGLGWTGQKSRPEKML